MKIEEKFQELDGKEGAYMPHIYFGDPSKEFSFKLVEILVKNGADFLEFGVPFSDPIADGPTFQASCERALDNETTLGDCIEAIKKLREDGLEIPVIVTTYYNIPYVFGIKNFMKNLSRAGVQGVIIPDLPIEEGNPILKAGQETGIDVIFQVTPNTSEERVKRIAAASTGFLYVMNFEGVTGTRDPLSSSAIDLIKIAKKCSDLPLMAGFGISEKEQAKALVSAGADGVITGSALADIYREDLENPENSLLRIEKFVREIKKGCIEGYREQS